MDVDIKKLADSKFNYWGGYVANLILIAFFLAMGLRSFDATRDSLLSGLGWAALGFFIYTLTEYIFHRFLYHEWTSVFVKGHALHHENPTGLLGLPWYIPYPFLIGIYLGLAWLIPNNFAVGVGMAMWWFGFVAYCGVHHSIHHFNFRFAWFRRLKVHHKVHHAAENTNYGVLTTFWDVIFRTKLQKASDA